MKQLVRLLVVVSGFVGFSAAQNTAPTGIQVNSIYAGADGKFEAAPDTAVLTLNIAAQQETAKAA